MFLRKIEDAEAYDVILIDEPESSFDNPFLYGEIKDRIKKISDSATVFLATHNNVPGVSAQPDKLLLTTVSEDGLHQVFSDDAGSGELLSATGEVLPRAENVIELMETGSEAYFERRPYYELDICR